MTRTADATSAAVAASTGGRPLDPEISARILTATLDLLNEQGFAKLSIEAVAKRCGVHRPAIYRRWPNKVELVVAAVRAISAEVAGPIDGDVRTNLVDTLLKVTEVGNHSRARGRFHLLAEVADDDVLAAEVVQRIVAPRRAILCQILERGQTMGQIRADVDLELVIDVLFGTLQSRLFIMHWPTGPAQVEKLVDTVLGGIATSPRA